MVFKLALFALGSIAVLVAANPLASRQLQVACSAGQTPQCCDFNALNDGDTQEALQEAGITSQAASGLTGSVGRNCRAPIANDPNGVCGDSVHLGCCPTAGQPSVTTIKVNCTAEAH